MLPPSAPLSLFGFLVSLPPEAFGATESMSAAEAELEVESSEAVPDVLFNDFVGTAGAALESEAEARFSPRSAFVMLFMCLLRIEVRESGRIVVLFGLVRAEHHACIIDALVESNLVPF